MIAAVVQARMGSSRLPGKTLADVAGRPMLARLVERARRIEGVQAVIIATTDRPADNAIVAFADQAGLPVHRGSETDVLDRVHGAATRFGASVIVRVTPDCPLLDPVIAGRVLARFREGGGLLDYVSNTQPPTFPDGQDTEVFSLAALATAWREARLTSEREHVTPFIWKQPGRFRLANVTHVEDLSHLRWTVDEPADLEFVRAVYRRLGAEQPFGMEDILELLEREPSLLDLNRSFTRNEGYAKSLRADRAAGDAPGGPSMDTPRRLTRSEEYFARAEKVIPSATQTFSKGHTQFVRGVAPLFLQRAQGSHVWDVDGNEYIDYPMALGPIVLGHNDPDVDAAVRAQLADGIAFSLPHPLEVEVSELLTEIIPCAEMVRFGKNGSDATSGAVRVARAYTGRERIAACGYHGWQDWYIGATTRHRGVPAAVRELTHLFAYNDVASLDRLLDAHPGQFAAVIMEPVGVVEPAGGFLEQVAARARAHGAVLIYDEVVTSFRVALGRRHGPLRRHARPGLHRQGDGQRLSGLGGGRTARHHAGLRRDLLLVHLRRRGAVAGGGEGHHHQAARRARHPASVAPGPAAAGRLQRARPGAEARRAHPLHRPAAPHGADLRRPAGTGVAGHEEPLPAGGRAPGHPQRGRLQHLLPP